jgi:hypothetical protein
MSTRKGMVLYKPKTDFKVRYVIVDYDFLYVYCIDLNDDNKVSRQVIKFTYKECNDNFIIE